MTVKYKVSDFAKDLNVSAKKVLDELAAMGSTGKKNSSTLEENELNYLLEKFSKDNSVPSLKRRLRKRPRSLRRKRQSPRPPRRSLKQSPLPLPQRQSSPRQTITTISTARRRTSSTRSARRRLSP